MARGIMRTPTRNSGARKDNSAYAARALHGKAEFPSVPHLPLREASSSAPSEAARIVRTVAPNGCYWAMNDLKKDHDSRIGVDGTSLCIYYGGELARGDRGQVHMGYLG